MLNSVLVPQRRLLWLAAFTISLAFTACAGDSTAPKEKDGGRLDGLTFPDTNTPTEFGILRLDGPQDGQQGDAPPAGDQTVIPDTHTAEPCTTPDASRPCTTTLPGVCKDGMQTCTDGFWTGCVATIQPGDQQEDCDNVVDDDCDGPADGDDPDCRPCTPNDNQDCDSLKPGVCAEGTQDCKIQDDGSWGWTKCEPKIAVGSLAEDCFGNEDRDCDDRLPVVDGDCNPCYNGTKDANETDVDCGGSCPVKCPESKDCAIDGDCLLGSCFLGECGPDLCVNNVLDGDETDVDCGGSCPTKCTHGESCNLPTECVTGRCENKTCVTCSTNTPTASGSGACPWSMNCYYRMTEVSGDGNRLKITCTDTSSECYQQTVYSYVDLSTFSSSGSGACPWSMNCYYRMTEISGDGNRLKITCSDTSSDCYQQTVYSYVDLSGATATGSGACPWSMNCYYRMTEISGDGNRLKITCSDTSSECYQQTVYSYVDLHGVETCQ